MVHPRGLYIGDIGVGEIYNSCCYDGTIQRQSSRGEGCGKSAFLWNNYRVAINRVTVSIV